MGQAGLGARRYPVAEYMALEEAAEVRHEFFEDEVSLGLRPVPRAIRWCSIMPLRCALVCAATALMAQRTVIEPVLIVEVVSKSAANRDRSWKFNQHKILASLRHYLLVS